jgi:hypothetical protein
MDSKLSEIEKGKQMRTFRGVKREYHAKVKIDGGPLVETWVLFGEGKNLNINGRGIGDNVYLRPQGWYRTDVVEFVDIIPQKAGMTIVLPSSDTFPK